jgi:hypothetical protein
MKNAWMIGMALVMATATAACGKSEKKDGESVGDSIANQLIIGMAKDTYAKAKADFDKGEDPTCIMDTNELKKIKSQEAQDLATNYDKICVAAAPARREQKRMETALKDVEKAQTDKDEAPMLKANQVLLKGACEDAETVLKDVAKANLSSEPQVKSLEALKAKACTKENLEGGVKTAAKK